ncbi:MAG TPA: hypothetical protein VE078_19185 [Thermoanaerobaculia bacterium]|nr:hypothetical protein [Thermoanaerobaculia bacterium]
MRLAALGLLLFAAPAWAGEVYSFTVERRGGLDESTRTGRVLVDGTSYRLELKPTANPRPFDVLISKSGDGKEIGLDLAGRTYYQLQEPRRDFPSSPLLRLWAMGPGKVKVSNVRLAVPETAAQETLSGLDALKREMRLTYELAVKFPGETVKGKVEIEVIRWLAKDKTLPLPSLLRPELYAALPEVDAKLTEALAKLAGFPVKQQMTITAVFAKGTSQTQVTTTVVGGLAAADTAPSLFEVPAGFRYEEPVMTRPGVTHAPIP